MTEIQQNRWDRLVRRTAGIVGGGSQVNDTLNELFPVLDVEGLKAELQILAGVYLGWGGQSRLSAAGEVGTFQLVNPTGSSSIIVPTKIIIGSSAADTLRISNVGGIFAQDVSVTGRRLDNRNGEDANTIGTVGSISQVAAVGGVAFIRTGTNTNITFENPNGLMILGAGTALKIGASNFNTFLAVSFFWRERELLPSETNLVG